MKMMSKKCKIFYSKFRILLWKAVLMRKYSIIMTIMEITLPIVLCLQIRLMFQPTSPDMKTSSGYSKDHIFSTIPKDTECWYTPKNTFVNDLMSRVSEKLRVKMHPAENELSLVKSYFSNNATNKVLWSIFEIDEKGSGKPKDLKYKIRSSEIGGNRMIMMLEEEPANEDPYLTSGFLAFQFAIESSFVEMWKSSLPDMGRTLNISRFPFYKADFLIMPSVVRPNISVIYYVTVAAFLLLPIATLQKVVHDKKTGLRGMMRLMNMSFSILYIGWLNYLMITLLPVTIACTIILHPVFSNTYAVVVAIFICMYVILSMFFMCAVGTFFSQSTKALLMAILFWFFMAHFAIILDQILVNAPLVWRIMSLILPHSGLLHGIVSFTSRSDFEDYHGEYMKRETHIVKPHSYIGLHVWPKKLAEIFMLRDTYDIVHVKERISICIILLVWILHIILWYLVTVYLDNLNPGEFGSSKPWYYWCKKPKPGRDDELTYRGSTNWSAVERTPFSIKTCIQVRCVTKKFGRIGNRLPAVREMTINFYRNEFSVILGHNGAGKSCLLKIIVGMYEPTSGHVYVDKINSYGKENSTESIGYCPQENILVNYMTTLQHIYMFGMMRGMTYKNANAEALLLLKQLNLESVKDLRITTCTFGVQRRVCLAMALIGNSEILVLDEPACGIDSEHKKQIWDLLSSIKRRKTILMATNSMDAADILADRIAIIANGRVECYGSKMYLSLRYGIGYILSLLVNDNCNLEKLRLEIQEFSSEPITLRGTMGMMVRFDVPRNSRFTKLLQHLEFNKQRLNIISMTLNAASIEGQFLRIGLTSKFKDVSLFYPSKKLEYLIQQRRRYILQSGRKWKRLSQSALRNQQIYAMFHKKLLHILSAWRLYTFSISLAIITLLLTTMLSQLSNFSLFKDTENVMNLTNYVANNLHVLYYAVNEKAAKDFLVYLYTTGQSYSDRRNYHISKNISATDLMIDPNLHSIEFRDRYVMSIDVLSDSHIDLAYSSTAVHSGPIALNLLHNALLRYHTGSDDCSIKLTSRPLMNPKQWQHLLIHPRSVRNWENAAIAITLFLLLPTIDLGVKEATTSSKTLQINTFGVTTLMYWVPMYLTDLCVYSLCIELLTMIILFAYHGIMQISAMEMIQMHTIFLFYGACAIPLGYCIQLLTSKAGYVYLTVILMNFFAVLVVNGSIVFPLITRTVGRHGRILFEMLLHAFPPYVLACTLSNYIMLNLHNRQCSYFNTCDTEFRVEDPCCQNGDEKNIYKSLDIMLTKQSGADYHHSVTDDVLLMISQVLFFHLVLHFFDENNRQKWYNYSAPSEKKEHTLQPQETVKKEHVKFMEQYGNTKLLTSKVALMVQNLRKEHKGKVILDGVNFCIHHQECFGLLGLNGAGKSTIFRILSNETRMTSGKIVMFDYEFTKNKDMFLGMIGYCPQTGGLAHFMTGRQCLQLYAALRGIPQDQIVDEVDKWLDVLELLDFENVKIGNCPWGVQRKICVLQSLIGDLPMVFMDEPSSGIDVMTRHAIGNTLHQVQEMGRSLLITTHNMWEAEALCLRVGVLVNGKFLGINFCEELKEKHGRNFILCIRLNPMIPIDNLNAIKNATEETFPGIHFKDYHLGILKYELHSDIPYSNIFDKLEKLRYKYSWMSDFSVNQPSMEDAFLDLVKDQKEDPVEPSFLEKLWAWLNSIIR